MPLTPTAAKGSVGLMIEGTSGMQTLLATTAVIATITGITAPSGSTGMKFYVRISGYTASGSFTITGTGTPNNSETVTVATPTAQQQQSAQTATFDYVSVNAYTAITNITTTGLTNGFITVYGIQAAKYNIPTTKFKSTRKVPLYSPNQYSGLMARDLHMIQTHTECSIDSFDSEFYGDLSMWWLYLLVGSPSWSTLPASPLSVVAAATIASSMTIANQPTAPGMKLILVFTGFTGNPSVTITGTSYGVTTTETITPTANGTYYSANVYSALTTIGGSTNGTTLAVTGVFGWKGTATSEGNRSTAALEHFDGVGSWVHPFTFATEGEFSVTTGGATHTLKGMAQDKLAVGDRTTNPLQVSRSTSVGFPVTDLPMAGWQTNVYLDDITGTAGTTIFLDTEEEIKINIKAPVEHHWTFNNLQTFTRAYPLKYECTFDTTYDLLNLLQSEKWRQGLKQYLQVQVLGEYIGTTGGVQYSKGWWWTLPFRYDGEYNQEGDPGRGNVFAKPKFRAEYDATTGASYSVTVVTRQPPNYTS